MGPGCGYCFTIIHERCKKNKNGTDKDDVKFRNHAGLTSGWEISFPHVIKTAINTNYFSLTRYFIATPSGSPDEKGCTCRTLAELDIRKKFGVSVLAIRRAA
jgi:hypothetical protein